MNKIGVQISLLLTAGLIFIAGNVSPKFFSFGDQNTQLKLADIPEDVRHHFSSTDKLNLLFKNLKLKDEVFQKQKEKLVQRKPAILPKGVKPLKSLKLIAPEPNMQWPTAKFEGDHGKLQNAKGKWVMLNIWASWCAPCIAEMPDLQEAADALAKDNFAIVLLNIDPMQKDTLETVENIFKKNNITSFDPLIAQNDQIQIAMEEAGQSLEYMSLPRNIFISPEGEVFAYKDGGKPEGVKFWSRPEVLSFFRQLAEEKT